MGGGNPVNMCMEYHVTFADGVTGDNLCSTDLDYTPLNSGTMVGGAWNYSSDGTTNSWTYQALFPNNQLAPGTYKFFFKTSTNVMKNVSFTIQ